MHSAGRNARLDEGESELFDNLSLVGVSGTYCGILTERQLTLEDYYGYGIRINLSNISTLRNINLARLPNGFLTLGAVGVWVGAAVLTPPVGWGIAATGLLSVIGYLTLKTPILAIETNAGDKHLVTGTQSELLRLCMMVDRVMHGSTIEEAKAGLRELEEERARRFATFEPKALLGTPGSIATPGLDLFEAEPVATDFTRLSSASPSLTASPAAAAIASNAARMGAQNPNSMAQQAPEGGIFASLDVHEPPNYNIPPPVRAPVKPVDNRSAYERAWGRPESPEWYHEKDEVNSRENRMDEAFSDAMGSFDGFEEGGIFDTPSPNSSPQSPSYSQPESSFDFSLFDDEPMGDSSRAAGSTSMANSPSTNYSPPTSHAPARTPPSYSNPSRPPSSSEMIRSALSRPGTAATNGANSGWGLPTPNETAVREECKPGLVKTAKAHSAWQGEISHTRALSAPAVDPERFEDEFPAVSKLANSMSGGRVRSAIGRPKKQNWLSSLLSPSPPRRDYAEVYGDADGSEHQGDARFRSSQLLRLRSDQDHQADVAVRARQMTSAPPASSARDALDGVITRVSKGEERAPAIRPESGELRFSQLRTTSQKGDGRLPGIRRLE